MVTTLVAALTALQPGRISNAARITGRGMFAKPLAADLAESASTSGFRRHERQGSVRRESGWVQAGG
jgi:hypothetical protein